MSIAMDALRALSLLGPASSAAIPEALRLLDCVNVDASVVCELLASCTTVHNRIGEEELAHMVATATRPVVRTLAAETLGRLFARKSVGSSTSSSSSSSSPAAPAATAEKKRACRVVVERTTCSTDGPRMHRSVQPVVVKEPAGVLVVDGRHLLTSLQSARSERQRHNTTWFHQWDGTIRGYERTVTGAMDLEVGQDSEVRSEVGQEGRQEEGGLKTMLLGTFRCLDEGMSDDSFEVRAACVLSIAMSTEDVANGASHRSAGTLKRMVRLLRDDEDVVRAAAAESMGRLGPTVLHSTRDLTPLVGNSRRGGSDGGDGGDGAEKEQNGCYVDGGIDRKKEYEDGRPLYNILFGNNQIDSDQQRVAMLACGPSSMVAACQREGMLRNWDIHKETFEF